MWPSISTIGLVVLGGALVGVNAAPSLVERSTIPGLDGLISSGCQSTLESLISSDAATCLNLPGTLAIFSTVANSSWIPPTNTWLSNFCAADPCTNDQITSTVGTAADGCSSELALLGLTKDELIQDATSYFTVTKEALCLRDSSNDNDLCAITTLESLQTALGAPLTPDLIIANLGTLAANNYALVKSILCTPCSSAAIALIRPAIPSDYLSLIDSFVGDSCGVDFTSTPTGSITVVTGTAAELAASATASTSGSGRTQVSGLVLGAAGLLSLVASLF